MGKMLGIIGGAGVAATNKLNILIEERFTKNGAYRDAHHPQVIIFQATQAPSRSMFLEGKGESFVPAYIDAGKRLRRFGATVICMACNTAHYEIGTLQKEIGLPFIDMVKETVLQAKQEKAIKIGMLASDGCIKGKVYEKHFKEICPEKEIVYPQKYFDISLFF
jgi:aspartate racemase